MIRRGVATAAVMAVVVTTLTVATIDAGAWTEGACTTPSGVTVVVDFQELGGGVHVRCAPQPVTNGFEALRQAGIDFATTVRFPGFLCRIAGKPANDPCQTTSPASAYWSYWIAQRGAAWCYSNLGAGARTPPPGSVEGWSFSLGRTSSTSPAPRAAVPAPLPGTAPTPLAPHDCDRRSDAPTPTTGPSPQPPATTPPAIGPSGAPAPGQGTGDPGTGSARPAGSPGGAPAGTGDDTVTSGAEAPTDGTEAGADDPTTADGAGDEDAGGDERSDDRGARNDAARSTAGGDEVARRDEQTASVDLGGDGDGSGSPLGVVLAVVLVAALSGGAVLARRRSRADTSA
jgi:hypothetical protein